MIKEHSSAWSIVLIGWRLQYCASYDAITVQNQKLKKDFNQAVLSVIAFLAKKLDKSEDTG